MLSRRTVPVWIGLLLLSVMFLMGQDPWGPVGPAITGINPTSGEPGQEVRITGIGFGAVQGSSTVTFNGSDAGSALSWTGDEIRVVVPAGTTTGQVLVTVEGLPSNAFLFTVVQLMQRLLPATGQQSCYDTWEVIDCPSPGQPFYGQDAQSVAHPMSYTDHGNGTLTDNVTGLMWQRCTAGLSGTDCSVGTMAKWPWMGAISYCNGLDLGGWTDWRLPDVNELQGIMHYDIGPPPCMDPEVFPGTIGIIYWSSSPVAMGDFNYEAWYVRSGASINKSGMSSWYWIRCVRGEMPRPSFTNNGDGTTTDNTTGLMWQSQDDGVQRDWESALSYCANLVLPPGGYTDWRLPNVKELRSIVDTSRYNPAIDTAAFPETKCFSNTTFYWTSTTSAGISPKGFSWTVLSYEGQSFDKQDKRYPRGYVRCVR